MDAQLSPEDIQPLNQPELEPEQLPETNEDSDFEDGNNKEEVGEQNERATETQESPRDPEENGERVRRVREGVRNVAESTQRLTYILKDRHSNSLNELLPPGAESLLRSGLQSLMELSERTGEIKKEEIADALQRINASIKEFGNTARSATVREDVQSLGRLKHALQLIHGETQ